MKQSLTIESARVEIGNSPMNEQVVAEVRLQQEDGTACFVTLDEVYGLPTFYLTEDSILERLQSEDEDLEAFYDELNDEHLLAAGEYDDFFAKPDEQWQEVFRYLIYLVRCEMEEVAPFIAATVGKRIDDLEIPTSDVEEDYQKG